MQQFSRGRAGNPFELPHVHATSHVEALNTLPNNGQLVVLAPLASLSVGVARELFVNCGWASDPANTLLLPLGGGAPGSMAAQLADRAAAGGARGPQQLRVEVAWRVPLTDEELRARKAEEEAALRVKVRCAISLYLLHACVDFVSDSCRGENNGGRVGTMHAYLQRV